ncbi:BMP family ABC transporter substrate-binding protein [Clostridium sp. Ade.TY]|uniref:BMP family lipoprotein n=1 Tax=Clostridium sp. Ade.TY TaxID=1391647 RepID=UPI0004198AAC|nr:BMP family ABC transporter substrate-binding protein [Clostridium sp. Ade.TY]
MDKLKRNKEISILLLLLVSLYLIMLVGGCKDGVNLVNRQQINIAILAQNFNDKSFGFLAKKGSEEAKAKYGTETEYVEFPFEVEGSSEQIDNLLRKSSEDNSMVICMGRETKSSVEKVSRERREKSFTIIDSKVEEANVKSIIFKHQEGSFLMGVVAGSETKTNQVGFVGALNDEMGLEFCNGYMAGVKTVNEKAAKGLIDGIDTRFIQTYSDEKKAYEKAIELYNQGCDIIFQTCGRAGIGVFKAAKERGKLAIGVDVDQKVELPEYKDQIISSMIKKVDKTVLNSYKEMEEGSFKSGIDNIEEYGVKDDIIDYAPSTEESVSKETMEKLKKYKENIKNGALEIPKKVYEVIEFKAE